MVLNTQFLYSVHVFQDSCGQSRLEIEVGIQLDFTIQIHNRDVHLIDSMIPGSIRHE